MQVAYEKAQAVKRAHEVELMGRANVVGVGVGFRQRGGVRTDEVAVVVMVRRKVARAQLAPADVIPTEIEGVPVDVQEVGEIVAHG
jgi:hypothetical protein